MTGNFIFCDKDELRDVIFTMLDEYKEELRKSDYSFLTPDEVRKKYGVSKPTLWRWDKSGKLRAKRLGRRVLYSEASIIKAMEE